MTALILVGCGSTTSHSTQRDPVTTEAQIPTGHPQAVEPVAGSASSGSAQTSPTTSSTSTGPDRPPTGPATVTNAPAKGAPTDAEVRAAAARFKAAVARYHLDQLNLAGSLLPLSSLAPGVWHVSIASFYTDYGLPVACGGILHVSELGVANKTLPCGTEVTFVYGNRAIRVPVIDRGPYIAGREWDLTGATAEALHFPGLGPIKWRIG